MVGLPDGMRGVDVFDYLEPAAGADPKSGLREHIRNVQRTVMGYYSSTLTSAQLLPLVDSLIEEDLTRSRYLAEGIVESESADVAWVLFDGPAGSALMILPSMDPQLTLRFLCRGSADAFSQYDFHYSTLRTVKADRDACEIMRVGDVVAPWEVPGYGQLVQHAESAEHYPVADLMPAGFFCAMGGWERSAYGCYSTVIGEGDTAQTVLFGDLGLESALLSSPVMSMPVEITDRGSYVARYGGDRIINGGYHIVWADVGDGEGIVQFALPVPRSCFVPGQSRDQYRRIVNDIVQRFLTDARNGFRTDSQAFPSSVPQSPPVPQSRESRTVPQPQSSASTRPAYRRNTTEKIVCQRCGGRIPANRRFCTQCGAKLR